ncbi:CLUMA_CG010622, isoform A [Clunio marinus]|uniref:CLUMA_CG010622, isoform A n=1 Tax=Clunio marinus TaxID=568069 RepID=A0A1J1IBV2_9DIPT|nr:CLUMA_CG010622, isoform A [Clunio marinus]
MSTTPEMLKFHFVVYILIKFIRRATSKCLVLLIMLNEVSASLMSYAELLKDENIKIYTTYEKIPT